MHSSQGLGIPNIHNSLGEEMLTLGRDVWIHCWILDLHDVDELEVYLYYVDTLMQQGHIVYSL